MILDDNLPDTLMEQKTPETESTQDNDLAKSETAKHLSVPLSSIGSIYRQTRMVNSFVNPAFGRLLASALPRFPNAKMIETIANQSRVSDEFNRHLAGAAALTAPLAQLAKITALLNDQFRVAIEPLTFSISRVLSDSLLPMKELAERIGEVSRVRDAFRHYGLWLAPSMPEELVAKIVSLYDSGASSGTVHSVVSRYYAKGNWQRLDEVLERCRNNSLLERRIKVIEEALRAHREGLYNLTVPGLLIHLEGIAADYVKKHKLLPQIKGQTKEIILTALEDTPYSLLDIRTYAGVDALIEYVEGSMFAFVDFDKEHVRLRGENKLYGHAVRHGRQVAFGTRMNSLRLFLFLDVMTLLED